MRDLGDTRHADIAYMWQVAREATPTPEARTPMKLHWQDAGTDEADLVADSAVLNGGWYLIGPSLPGMWAAELCAPDQDGVAFGDFPSKFEAQACCQAYEDQHTPKAP